jgi:hypothetical protein
MMLACGQISEYLGIVMFVLPSLTIYLKIFMQVFSQRNLYAGYPKHPAVDFGWFST